MVQFEYLISESGKKVILSVFMKILIKSAPVVTLFKLIGIEACEHFTPTCVYCWELIKL